MSDNETVDTTLILADFKQPEPVVPAAPSLVLHLVWRTLNGELLNYELCESEDILTSRIRSIVALNDTVDIVIIQGGERVRLSRGKTPRILFSSGPIQIFAHEETIEPTNNTTITSI